MGRIGKQKRLIIESANKRLLSEDVSVSYDKDSKSTNLEIDLSAEGGKIKMDNGSLWALYAESVFTWVEVNVLQISENEITVKHPVWGGTLTKSINPTTLNHILKMYELGKKIIYFKDKENNSYKLVNVK